MSHRKQSNPEDHNNLTYLHNILDSISAGLFTVDREMRITYCNKAAEVISGVTCQEALNKPCYEVFLSDSCTVTCPIADSIATREPIKREVEIIDRKGIKKLISICTSPLYDSDSSVVGAVASIEDLTPAISMKEEIRSHYSFHNLVSRNPAMLRLFDMIEDIAASNAAVLLNGESGTGKELFAKAIHDLSPRCKGPMITVNCGSMPEALLESEIFGVRKGGTFAAATENRPGRLEMCYGGTFFLNEIGDLPLSLQAKLLRVIENQEFQPLGGRAPLKADVRFITATHRNLEEMVAQGTFRRDLYFRINIVTLNIPPLRDRREDIPLLVDMALQRFNQTYNKNVRTVSPELLKIIQSHSFPGNVRELQNLIEQSVILCKGGEITLNHLPAGFGAENTSQNQLSQRSAKIPSASALRAVLDRHSWNRVEAAKELGVERTTLWRWMKRNRISDQQ